jgi:hypothetical protein
MKGYIITFAIVLAAMYAFDAIKKKQLAGFERD